MVFNAWIEDRSLTSLVGLSRVGSRYSGFRSGLVCGFAGTRDLTADYGRPIFRWCGQHICDSHRNDRFGGGLCNDIHSVRNQCRVGRRRCFLFRLCHCSNWYRFRTHRVRCLSFCNPRHRLFTIHRANLNSSNDSRTAELRCADM